ncbi:MAG: hypothetical protein HKL88_02625 [Bacteroidia bacterium]|nr:hypothetical protein [Bacteroidia bacterium]
MRKIYNNAIVFTGVFTGLLLSSCRQGNGSQNTVAVADTLHTAAQGDKNTEDTVAYMLPSPMQIGVIFRRAGLSYMPGLTNQTKDISKYDSKYSQALNMGIYAADLTYCVLNRQNEDAMSYLKTLRSLADKLGFGSVFEINNMAKRFEQNLNTEDSLTDITSDLQMETDTYLGANNEKYIGAISFAGAWIESMYIGSKVYGAKTNDRISDRISEQMTILNNLIKSLNSYSSRDSHIPELVNALNAIESTYSSFPEVKSTGDSNQEAKLTNEHISQIGKQIEDLRQKFIS